MPTVTAYPPPTEPVLRVHSSHARDVSPLWPSRTQPFAERLQIHQDTHRTRTCCDNHHTNTATGHKAHATPKTNRTPTNAL